MARKNRPPKLDPPGRRPHRSGHGQHAAHRLSPQEHAAVVNVLKTHIQAFITDQLDWGHSPNDAGVQAARQLLGTSLHPARLHAAQASCECPAFAQLCAELLSDLHFYRRGVSDIAADWPAGASRPTEPDGPDGADAHSCPVPNTAVTLAPRKTRVQKKQRHLHQGELQQVSAPSA